MAYKNFKDDHGFYRPVFSPSEPARNEAVDKLAEAKARKDRPIFSGAIAYFPDALMEVARVSLAGSIQHHPGKPLHWEYAKSTDHKDAMTRHAIDAGTYDTDGQRHSAKAAWRALANLQTELEKEDAELHAKRQAQRDAQANG